MPRNTKRISPTRGKKISIALNSPIIIEAELPFSVVYYPEHYGTFFGFAESNNSEIFLCSCNIDLISNYEKIRNSSEFFNYSSALDNARFSNKQFPKTIAANSLDKDYTIQYKNKLCHRCNFKTPSLRYCHEMYGGKFKQHYGWYTNQIQLRFSYLKYYNNNFDFFPSELIPIINEIFNLRKKREELTSEFFDRIKFLQANEIEKSILKLERKIDNFFENIAREEFGFRKIGEGNVSELLMSKLIQQIYPDEELLMHHRPKWLLGLELDVFLPNINIGFEYQGQQHFYAIKAWGGKKALDDVKKRDQIKRNICIKNNITLIEIDYTEPLEKEYILQKINKQYK